MRFVVLVLTNKREREFAIDFYLSWPFVAFENLSNNPRTW